MKTTAILCALLVSLPVAAQDKKKADPQVERGRYITKISGCHDCHMPGYAPSGGKVPESQYPGSTCTT